MRKQAVFTVELEPDLQAALIAEAEAAQRPPSDIDRNLIDGFVREQRDACAHDAWFRAEVAQALREADDPAVQRIPDSDVEASWERKRAKLVRRLSCVKFVG